MDLFTTRFNAQLSRFVLPIPDLQAWITMLCQSPRRESLQKHFLQQAFFPGCYRIYRFRKTFYFSCILSGSNQPLQQLHCCRTSNTLRLLQAGGPIFTI